MARRLGAFIVFLICFLVPCTAQSSAADVPKGFSGIILGEELDRVKSLLQEDPNFDFRGDPDVSLLMRPNESLIECRGFSFIARAYFQFYERKLYTMTLVMNEELIDHYTLYTRFTEKYGEPDSLSPTGAVWESEALLFTLERPLSVKYVDRETFEMLRRLGRMEDSTENLSRERFLELF